MEYRREYCVDMRESRQAKRCYRANLALFVHMNIPRSSLGVAKLTRDFTSMCRMCYVWSFGYNHQFANILCCDKSWLAKSSKWTHAKIIFMELILCLQKDPEVELEIKRLKLRLSF